MRSQHPLQLRIPSNLLWASLRVAGRREGRTGSRPGTRGLREHYPAPQSGSFSLRPGGYGCIIWRNWRHTPDWSPGTWREEGRCGHGPCSQDQPAGLPTPSSREEFCSAARGQPWGGPEHPVLETLSYRQQDMQLLTFGFSSQSTDATKYGSVFQGTSPHLTRHLLSIHTTSKGFFLSAVIS